MLAVSDYDRGVSLAEIVRKRKIHPRRLFDLLGLSEDFEPGLYDDSFASSICGIRRK
jgi:hypothetical protein